LVRYNDDCIARELLFKAGFMKDLTDPDACRSFNLTGTLALHHSQCVPFIPGNSDLIRVPSKSNAATLAELFGFRLRACRHEREGPSESDHINDPELAVSANLWKKGWTRICFYVRTGLQRN
jgi:hypothetical protein